MIPGVIGSGTWATALVKLLTDNGQKINWCVRSEAIIQHLKQRHHNPSYLSSVYFDTGLLNLNTDVAETIRQSDLLVIVVPSAYVPETLSGLPRDTFRNKMVLSAIKGILPYNNLLLNDYLKLFFDLPMDDYFTVMGPCHAEEVASEKLSYLTFSGMDTRKAENIASLFSTEALNTVVNNDVIGVQYAAVLKNIYALGAGIAHGLEYGDNFLSVLIANCADEMAGFLNKSGVSHPELMKARKSGSLEDHHKPNYAASVYLGDLLVTCYSLFSRNRTFGNMIGKGYSVRTAQLEMNMVAEGYNASKSIWQINKGVGAEMPVAEIIYRILWENLSPAAGFREIEKTLI